MQSGSDGRRRRGNLLDDGALSPGSTTPLCARTGDARGLQVGKQVAVVAGAGVDPCRTVTENMAAFQASEHQGAAELIPMRA